MGSMNSSGGVWTRCDMPMRLDIGDGCLVVGAERIWLRLRAPGVIGGEFGWRLKYAAGGRSCVAMALGMRRCSHVGVVASGWLAGRLTGQLRMGTYQ
jgi:hypothetical protein